jgi:hypothetical protein
VHGMVTRLYDNVSIMKLSLTFVLWFRLGLSFLESHLTALLAGNYTSLKHFYH